MSNLPDSMKAVVATVPGGPETLTLVERPCPRPGPGEVLIAVEAAGVNRPDIMQRSGALPAPPGASDILGLEVAGRVIALGADVDASLAGQRVMALVLAGGYADYAVAKADHCLSVPDAVSTEMAGVLPEGLFTLQHNLFTLGALAPGETVLIHGGASGIGTLGLQLALAHGATVIVTAGGPEKCARLREMGVSAIDYREGDHSGAVLELTGGRGVNVVLDIAGGDRVSQNLACMAPGGRHVSLSFMAGPVAPVDFSLVMRKGLWLTSSTLRPKTDAEKREIRDRVRETLMPHIADGPVRPVISKCFPLDAAGDAHAWLESGENFGKVVLSCGGEAR